MVTRVAVAAVATPPELWATEKLAKALSLPLRPVRLKTDDTDNTEAKMPVRRSWTAELSQPELVLDTRGIVENATNLTRVAQHPRKEGKVLEPEHPWEAGLYFYSSVVQVSAERFHLYYGCAGPANETTTFLCVAVSTDGIHYTKPLDVGAFVYAGSTQNNIVWSTPYNGTVFAGGHKGTGWSNSVTFDDRPEVPEAERFKLLYDTDNPPFSPRHLLVATSSDGFHWTQLLMTTTPHGALVSQSNFADTNTCLLWIRRLQRYVAFGRIDGTIRNHSCNFLASEKTHPGNFRQVGAIIETTVTHHNDTMIPFSSRNFSAKPTSIYHIENNDNVSTTN
eukprot:COSAG05_NODE_225_length_13597_cov_18.878723_14_plen_336_part_00